MTPHLSTTEEQIFALARPYLTAARDNEVHTQIALEFGFRLLETEKGERQIVIPALILHDVGYSAVPAGVMHLAYGPRAELEVIRIHETKGAAIAAAILEKTNFDAAKTAEILRIIDGHDTRRGALSLNDQIVKDADKLTRYTRNFLVRAGEFHMTYQDVLDRLEHFIGRWFFLEASREIAREELARRRAETDQGQV